MLNEPDTGLRLDRPTINVAEEDNSALAGGLLSLIIVENTNGLYHCEAMFRNWGNINNGTSLLNFGKAFKVKLGVDTIFDGKIMGLEANFPEGGPPELNVLAEGRFQDLRMT